MVPLGTVVRLTDNKQIKQNFELFRRCGFEEDTFGKQRDKKKLQNNKNWLKS